jgi:hypothetical protein
VLGCGEDDGIGGKKGGRTHRAIDNLVVPRLVVDIDGDATERGHFLGKLREERVILSAATGVNRVGWRAGEEEEEEEEGTVRVRRLRTLWL